MRNNNATQDKRLILQLERLREDAEMRKARRWWRDAFWPRSAADYLKVEIAHGTQENKWLRQVATYWGMTASFVLDGTLSEKAFLRPEFSDEVFSLFAKVHPFLRQLRSRTRNPDFMANVEKVILSSKTGRDRLRDASRRTNSCTKVTLGVPVGDAMQRQGMNREGNRDRA
ncbi:MAG TPA: hypothetical protein VGJ06_13355 [Candidatus Acidoferrum sp.]|jgi:hypothetical protein